MDRKADLYIESMTQGVDEIKDFLRKKGVSAVIHDISTEEGARKRMLEATRGACGPPVVEIGHQIVCGFDPERLEETIKYEFR
jgi:glutaredoxin